MKKDVSIESEAQRFIIFTVKEWNQKEASRLQREHAEYVFFVFNNPEDMKQEEIERINPRFIFFPHWSWIIPESILERWECVIFHLGDVPQGRGGSPLQNHIERKIYNTKLSALRATKTVDRGPVYCKRDVSLFGDAEEIYLRVSRIIFREIIPFLIENTPEAQEQKGEGSFFPRRKKDKSDFQKNTLESLDDVFDLIRMLDAQEYPKAYLDYGPFRLTFGRAQRKYGKIIADVEITTMEEGD